MIYGISSLETGMGGCRLRHTERQMDVRRVIHSLVEFQSWEEPLECLTRSPSFIDGETKAQRRERTWLKSHYIFVELFLTLRLELISNLSPSACCMQGTLQDIVSDKEVEPVSGPERLG